MASRIVHRGPDDEGVWEGCEGRLAFGFRRLSIIDLSPAGHQPMVSSSGRYCTVFNGEIYNFRALRGELESRGATFRGGSDTEVLLAAFEAWGVRDTVSRLVGMFAVAVWDARERRLFLVRDRLGLKPLFVYERNGTLAFASELKSLRVLPGFDAELDLESLAQYFRYLYVPAPHSIYRHVHKLLPGTILEVDTTTLESSVHRYWDVREVAERGRRELLALSADEAVDHLEAEIREAVADRLYADVPMGAFLSAGVDSTTVVGTMQELSSRPVKTFSIAFDAAEHNEADVAAEIAQHLGTDHTELMLTGREALDVVPLLPDLFDEPHADTSQIPQFLLCRKAREHVTVALSGDGGDEVFGGYNRYVFGSRLLRRAEGVPRWLRHAGGTAVGTLSPERWDRMFRATGGMLPAFFRQRLPGEKVRKIGAMLKQEEVLSMYRSLVSAWPDPAEIVPGTGGRRDVLDTLSPGRGERGLQQLMMLNDQLTYLPDDQLAKVDRVSMATSLEVRVPLVDHRLVELSWRLPMELKIREDTGKWLLRQVLYRKVPRRLVERPKMGLSVPLAAWLRGPLRPWAEELIQTRRPDLEEVMDFGPVRSAWDRLIQGSGDAALGLWAVLGFVSWHRRWLG